MPLIVCQSREELGQKAGAEGARLLREAIGERGAANLILATGTSQFGMLTVLRAAPGIAWEQVTGFHLDEYVGLAESHPASFRRYLKERFVGRLPFRAFHYLNGEGDPEAECQRVGEILRRHPIDVAFVGIGENGHLAFNDPPADFQTEAPYLVVTLDAACRRQQLGEGWFQRFEDVPRQAISMSARQIMKSRHIICAVPEARKAEAVKQCFAGPVRPEAPASILQQHERALVYLDSDSAALLRRKGA